MERRATWAELRLGVEARPKTEPRRLTRQAIIKFVLFILFDDYEMLLQSWYSDRGMIPKKT